MRANFARALKFVLDHENVYAPGHFGDYTYVVTENVSGDAGGLTKWGIDQASHPDINIKALDYDGAKQLYLNDWRKCRCDDLPNGLDIAVFDTAENMGGPRIVGGKGTAIILLQQAINNVSQLSTLNSQLTVDGFIGPKTISAAQSLSPDLLAKTIAELIRLRFARYHAIADRNPQDRKFLNGWLDRTADLNRALVS